MKVNGHLLWIWTDPSCSCNNGIGKLWIPLIQYKYPFHGLVLSRDLVGIEYYVGDGVIEYTLFNSNTGVRLGHLEEESCHGMVPVRKKIDGHKGGQQIADNRKGDNRRKKLKEEVVLYGVYMGDP